jgi:hypothetical protein
MKAIDFTKIRETMKLGEINHDDVKFEQQPEMFKTPSKDTVSTKWNQISMSNDSNWIIANENEFKSKRRTQIKVQISGAGPDKYMYIWI